MQQKNPLYSRSIYKGFFKNVAKPGFWGCLGITGDDGRRTRNKNDLWKAWKSGKLKFTTLPPFPQATTTGVRFILKKNIHFLFFTMDEGRRTKDERRTAPKPVFLLLHKAHTQRNTRINKNKVLYKKAGHAQGKKERTLLSVLRNLRENIRK